MECSGQADSSDDEMEQHQQRKQQEFVTNAQGFDLHLSRRSKSGYKGVYVCRYGGGHCFEARVGLRGLNKSSTAPALSNGTARLGYFATAVEAAVAYAKAVASAPTPPTPSPSLERKRLAPDARVHAERLRKKTQRLGHDDKWGHRKEADDAGKAGEVEGEVEEQEMEGEEEGEALVAEGGGGVVAAAAAAAEEEEVPLNLPLTVQKLKRFFSSEAQSIAGFKPALERMEMEAYGAVKTGALDLRVRSLSLEFSAGL